MLFAGLMCPVHLLRSDLTEATLAGATISLVAAVAIIVLLTAVSTSLDIACKHSTPRQGTCMHLACDGSLGHQKGIREHAAGSDNTHCTEGAGKLVLCSDSWLGPWSGFCRAAWHAWGREDPGSEGMRAGWSAPCEQELSSFLALETREDLVVDRSAQGELLRINFNISFPALSCEFATLDVSDALGTVRGAAFFLCDSPLPLFRPC